jgi:uncharacterized membrane protein YeaQ/YmgE (transglycosylase-associated protein family)
MRVERGVGDLYEVAIFAADIPRRAVVCLMEIYMDITNLLVQLVSGAIGGNVAGAAMKKSSLGTLGNSIAGILGGGVGAQILAALGASSGAVPGAAMSLEQIVSNVAGGGVGGAVLIAIIGAIRKSMAAKSSS